MLSQIEVSHTFFCVAMFQSSEVYCQLIVSLLASNSVIVGTYICAKSSVSGAVDDAIECHRNDQNKSDWSPLHTFAVGNPAKAEVPLRLP